MRVKGFYLDRYMIAVYQNDMLICVADNVKELCDMMHISRRKAYYRIHCGAYNLIDITQIHNDCFIREDLEFLREVLQTKEVGDVKRDRKHCL